MRYFIELGYDGAPFCGWQVQPDAPSVQEEIEKALFTLLRTTISITGCGRTDTGVHARFYVAHADLPDETDADQLRYKLNKILPPAIAVHRIFPVNHELHARFSATFRTYRYFVHFRKDPFAYNSLYLANKPSIGQMNEAAAFFLGKQDFTSLSKLHTDVKTNICTVTHAKWVEMESDHWYFEITADRFLRNMVRATVGTLLEAGYGKISPQDIPGILEARSRSAAKTSVAAKGLFLWNVGY